MVHNNGWLVLSNLLKNLNVNWDDDIPSIYRENKKMFQTTNQLHDEHGHAQQAKPLNVLLVDIPDKKFQARLKTCKAKSKHSWENS